MGTGKESSPAWTSKPAASTQEKPTSSSYPDWSTSMQAYLAVGATPPPYFSSPVASQAQHPYVWGSQLLVPHGTALPYPVLYPHGGPYAHPNMAVGAALTNAETEAKASNGKDPASIDKSKETSRNTGLAGEKSERGKTASGSGNVDASQSAESASEGSSESSEEILDEQASSAYKKRSFNQMLASGDNLKTTQFDGKNLLASVPGKPAMPATNLNIGMDLWDGSPAGPTPITLRMNSSGPSPPVAPSMMVEHENERELKREKRKQSNRESAKRSRLRKQAECEQLQFKVQKLRNETSTLKVEVMKVAEECLKITSDNESIKVELTKLYGPDAISKLEDSYHSAAFHSANSECSSRGGDTSIENNS